MSGGGGLECVTIDLLEGRDGFEHSGLVELFSMNVEGTHPSLPPICINTHMYYTYSYFDTMISGYNVN